MARSRSRPPRPTLLAALLAGLLLACLASLAGADSALAAGAWWHLDSGAAPSVLPAGGEAQLDASASNLGYEDILASEAHPITLIDTVPAGLEIVPGGVRGYARLPHDPLTGRTDTGRGAKGKSKTELKCEVSGQTVTCAVTHPIYSYEGLEMVIAVKVNAAVGSKLPNEVKIEGGETEASGEPVLETVQVGGGATPFGLQKYELKPENAEGKLETQAGAHPFQLTTTLNLNQTLEANRAGQEEETAPALVRDLHFVLPPGLLGNVTVVPQCTELQFHTVESGDVNQCPADTAVGVARIKLNEPVTFQGIDAESVPIFNLVPAKGEPAAFGIEIDKVPVVLNTAVRTGSDYAVEVSVMNSTQAAALLQSQVTFWGVPGDPRHDASRGWECVGKGYWVETAEPARPCKALGQAEPKPFLTLPASCATKPLTTVSGDSWPTGPERKVGQLEGEKTSFELPSAQEGCNLLDFSPAIAVEPESHSASEPSGLTVKVDVPQTSTLAEKGRAEADVKDTTVVLPEGVLASPGAANGLDACTGESIGLAQGFAEASQLENDHFGPGEAGCPNASKIGTVAIKTPLLKKELLGSVFLARQDNNLLEEKLVLYLTAYDEESGVRVKLAGEVHLDQSTGELTSRFANTPPVPFSELTLKFFGGGRASQSTPRLCGNYTTHASFAPSTEGSPASASSTFAITSGPGGTPCPAAQSFAPSLQAGSINTQAGAFTPFTLTIGHSDADQTLQALTVHLPPGVAAMLSSVTPCPEPQAAENECGAESLIGHSTASSGLGSEPFTLGGSVYLTGPYKGAPFGLSVVTPAVAGPFNLGDVTVRSKIDVDPNTAAVTITSDPFPTFVRGVPVQLKQINVTVDRPGFQFNPTNCNPMAITGTLSGAGGAGEPVSYPFQATNCTSLPFAPKLTASTNSQASKPNGASLNVKVESGGLGQANIAKVDLTLPLALPSRLSTIQKACVEAVFNANPAACDEGSNIGYAVIHTPVLKKPLTGPAYLVSHGGAAFPDVEFVLQGEGITLVLDGKTDIKKGITYSRFESAPDAPFTTFETFLPTGPHSALTAYVPASKNYSLCGANLAMPTEIVAQDGAVVKQTTNIAPSGCKGVASYKVTRAQRLAKALKACRKLKQKSKRAACELKARRQYGPKKTAKKKTAKKK